VFEVFLLVVTGKPERIMNGLKIMCMKMDHMIFLNSVSFLQYLHDFNTEENLDYGVMRRARTRCPEKTECTIFIHIIF